MPKILLSIAAILLCLGLTRYAVADDDSSATSPPVKPILRAHAHNDYEHSRPCLDALDNGFCSIEADVFLIDGALLVAHYVSQVKPERTLEALYLEPLRERARRFNGKIFPDAEKFYLWIDLKTESRETYAALKKVLEKYADTLTRYENGKEIPGAVTVVLTGSGSSRVSMIQHESPRYVSGVDGGGPQALDADVPASLIPVVGMNWRKEFPQFNGKTLSPDEQKQLAEHVRKANEQGRKLRYWNAPDREEFWQILYDAGVHFINTDRLEPLRKFLTERE